MSSRSSVLGVFYNHSTHVLGVLYLKILVEIAQLVEQWTENPLGVGSNPTFNIFVNLKESKEIE